MTGSGWGEGRPQVVTGQGPVPARPRWPRHDWVRLGSFWVRFLHVSKCQIWRNIFSYKGLGSFDILRIGFVLHKKYILCAPFAIPKACGFEAATQLVGMTEVRNAR